MARRTARQSRGQNSNQNQQQPQIPPQANGQNAIQNDLQNSDPLPPPQRTRAVYGPQSALTDFLASHNISATRIREDADARRRAAAASRENDQSPEPTTPIVAESSTSTTQTAQAGASRRRNGQEGKALEKIKQSKSFKKRKRAANDSDDDDEIARAIFEERSAPLPGQMENCAICEKRFTVTPYSVAGPEGGLLCAPCGRQRAKELQDNQPKKKPRKQAAAASGVGRRRTIQSRILDGDVGTKSLATLCVQTLAKNVDLAESLGDLPDHLIDKIARMFSKRRLLKSETLPLFVQADTEVLSIYDSGRLSEQDLIRIFQESPRLRHLKICCGIQFKDEVMSYLLTRDISLESFYLHGANLLSEEMWQKFLEAKGQTLKRLQVYYTDKHFGDDSLELLSEHCPNLTRLKVENNQMVTDNGIRSLAKSPKLEHLGLQLQNKTSNAAYIFTLSQIGQKLQTFSLKIVPDLDDTVLMALHEHCRSLAKLRITDSEQMTDQGFANLFKDWANPPIQYIDFQKCRQLDSTTPRANPKNIGLCSEGFKALMQHSGRKIRHLNVHACRHISRQAFEEVFNEKAEYPELKKLEISFCEEVTDFIVGSIFRACPNIREVNVFGCMKVREVLVPRGVILVGVPNARGMITEGHGE